jgi:hypothetical protein
VGRVVDVLSVLFGLATLTATGLSVLWTLVVPRATPSRLAEGAIAVVRRGFLLAVRPLSTFTRRDAVLALLPPVALLSLLVVWLGLLAVGFAALAVPATGASLVEVLEQMTAAVLGLGFDDSSRTLALVTMLAVLAGVIVVALLIGYLPTLYGAFNTREQLVSLLDARAGSPAWGVELLLRHTRDGTLEDLPSLFSAWESWAADVGESHSSYPILTAFRSQDPARSWITAVLAVLDAAALDVALRPGATDLQARLALRAGFIALRSVADTAGLDVDHDPHPDGPLQLERAAFDEAVASLVAVGYPAERDADAAWPHFRGWRVNYEQAAYALADRIVAPPAPWSGPRTHLPDGVLLPDRPVDRRPGAA